MKKFVILFAVAMDVFVAAFLFTGVGTLVANWRTASAQSCAVLIFMLVAVAAFAVVYTITTIKED